MILFLIWGVDPKLLIFAGAVNFVAFPSVSSWRVGVLLKNLPIFVN